MSHKGSYKWIRRTQYIPRFGEFYKNRGILLGGCLTEKNEILDNERESSSLGRLARFVDDELDFELIWDETFSDSASDDSKDYGFDDDEFLKEQEVEQKKRRKVRRVYESIKPKKLL